MRLGSRRVLARSPNKAESPWPGLVPLFHQVSFCVHSCPFDLSLGRGDPTDPCIHAQGLCTAAYLCPGGLDLASLAFLTTRRDFRARTSLQLYAVQHKRLLNLLGRCKRRRREGFRQGPPQPSYSSSSQALHPEQF